MIDALDYVTLKQGEKIVGVYRSHWVTALGGTALGLLLTIAPFFFMAKLFSYRLPGAAAFAVLANVTMALYDRLLGIWMVLYWTGVPGRTECGDKRVLITAVFQIHQT